MLLVLAVLVIVGFVISPVVYWGVLITGGSSCSTESRRQKRSSRSGRGDAPSAARAGGVQFG